MEFGTYPTGWYIEGDLSNQVAVSTGSTVTSVSILIKVCTHLLNRARSECSGATG